MDLKDLFPILKEIKVTINNINSEIYAENIVEEFVDTESTVKAYLLHISIPKGDLKDENNYLLLEIIDNEEISSQASIYFGFEK